MKKTLISAAVAASCYLPASAGAVEVVGELLEIYGKLHVSADYVDSDRPQDDSELVLSSNSSRLGFKGKYPVSEQLTMLYQVEQGITLDEDADDTFATRDTFLGVSGGFGDVLVGRIDTPFKDTGGAFTVLGDTVADQRAILGATSGGGNTMNQRGADAIMWRYATDALETRLMYSPNGGGDAGEKGNDGNAGEDSDTTLVSASVLWEQEYFAVGAAYEDWDDLKGFATDGWRLGASYDFGLVKLGGIYEDIDSDNPRLSRPAYGANVTFQLNDDSRLLAQWLHADESEAAGGDDEADQFSLGAETTLDERTTVYAVYTQLDNAENARYQGIDGGHGEELLTVPGGDPRAFSVGAVFAF